MRQNYARSVSPLNTISFYKLNHPGRLIPLRVINLCVYRWMFLLQVLGVSCALTMPGDIQILSAHYRNVAQFERDTPV